MRKLKPQPKEKRIVSLDHEFRESMIEVRELLEEFELNPDDAFIDFDDAIQVGSVCGGRVGSPKRPFVFTFYPQDDSCYGSWFLSLHETEIEDIADGVMTEISMWCCTSPDCRSKFRDESETCFFCDYEDDVETVALQQRLKGLATTVKSKEEWVTGYLQIKPDASCHSLIADYNPIDGLGERLGWFSSEEAQEMLDGVRSHSRDQE